MKHLTLAAFLFSILITSSACRRDKVKGCTNPVATNYSENATEDDNSCQFERDKFVAVWNGIKTCSVNPEDSTASITISAAPENFTSVRISNFPDNGLSVLANVNPSDAFKFIIPTQDVTLDLDVFSISGTGVVYQNTLVVNYIKNSGTVIDTCGLGLTKVE